LNTYPSIDVMLEIGASPAAGTYVKVRPSVVV
jgi:hypothetical protein